MTFKNRGAAVTALTAMAVVAAAGVANADTAVPAGSAKTPTVSTDVAPGVRYSDDAATGLAVLRTPFGTVAVQGGQFGIQDTAGHTVAGAAIPAAGPSAQSTAAHAAPARLAAPAPVQVAAPAQSAPAQQPPDDVMSDLNQAVEAANPHMGMAMGVGSLAGSVVGAAIGCPFGVATGGTLMALATAGTMTVPAFAATCLVGAVAVGGVGALVGGVALAIPVGIAAGAQKFNELQAQHHAPPAAAPTGPAQG
ncbi:hypothetical protein K7711_40760 [Nocardia sp. CA2R105]|uniref:hypothetical protein n=1 Tax=Nocardia coffeae TaxID=2873381 RepID=UPI001CA68F9B|nr:hypothetical protein [Nocardia coffeae]MBY8862859.1 hypothetical protein [Nocardia coffeae]